MDRVDDLLARMTLEEKAGLMFVTMVTIGEDGALHEGDGMFPSTRDLVEKKHITHVNIVTGADPRTIAAWHNRVQDLAAGTRLGIPMTIASDPRHGFVDNPATSAAAGAFSRWPEPLGLAATRDPDLVRHFADVVRREYLATGIRVALHPMADLATEPRWARTIGTFGADASLAARMVAAYIRGLQGDTLGPHSVAAMTKHFPGAGPQKDGEDAHFAYGREQVYPGNNFDYHLEPFEAAFEAGTSQIMPYYGMPVGLTLDGKPVEEVGFGFNADIIDGLLRGRYGFDGIVCTDWGLVSDAEIFGAHFPARAWGVEHLSRLDRVEKILNAGADQFGGESCPELIVALVESGRITEERVDRSVRRILREKFRLGLFDEQRYVDVDAAAELVGRPEYVEAGLDAQRKSIVVLKEIPPTGTTLYVEGVDPAVAARYATVVDRPEDADLAIVRRTAPFEPRGTGFESFFHAGRLEYTPDETADLVAAFTKTPTVFDVLLDRAAIIPEVVSAAAAVTGNFGASDEALLDVVFGRVPSTGRLPLELPSSTAAVEASDEDVPNDTKDPLFEYGFGL